MKNPYIILSTGNRFPVGTDEHDERVYQKAAENFRNVPGERLAGAGR